ncbi:MAG: class I SAM-dependent methyltransferase [Opitutaceae bacterium]|nr:class I SAM-dependent methyltransferase [Opitutaceae bacterium]MBP9912374.1 class I SAM-dependent methyltransferase [Opitutaceae bacterium]
MESAEYHKMAAVEDAMWYYRALHAHVARELKARLPAGPARVLDAGCGTGGLIRRLGPMQPDWHWTGIDVEPLACALARQLGAQAVLEGSVSALPFGDGEFDAVVSADVLYHLDDDEAALHEMRRVLRPGGIMIINVPAHRWLWSYHDVAVHGRRRYGRSEMTAKLARAGLRMAWLTHWNTILLPLIAARRKLLPAPKGGSDVKLAAPWVEATLTTVMRGEAFWLQHISTLPAGSSILAVAQR